MFNKRFQTKMIRWRLRVLMAERNINNKTLAEWTGIHPTTISRLKNADELKQITGEVLNALCNALGCTPNDLIEFTLDTPPEQTSLIVELGQTRSSRRNTSSTAHRARDDSQAVA